MKTGSGALAFDAVIDGSGIDDFSNKAGKKISDFSKKAVDDFDKVDKAVKKVAESGVKLSQTPVVKLKMPDIGPVERKYLGFNQKLERSSRELGVTFSRTGRDAIGFSSGFSSSMSSAEKAYQRFAGTARNESQGIADSFKTIAGAAIGFSAAGALAQLPGQLIKVRGEFQNLEIAFETMLGNKAKADKLMAEVVQLAATTPFGLKDAAAATKQLLAYGSSAKEVIGELRRLGDVAAGVGAPIQDLTYLYGTLRAQGRAYAVDIRQFAGRGIPIYKELANVLGVADDKIRGLVEQGKVGFKEVEQAFVNMTSSGGQFFNLMEKQSKSLAGLSSQLGDAIDIMFNNMGKSQEGFLATALKGTIGLVQNYEAVTDALTAGVIVWGAYKTAVILAAAATRANLVITETMAVQQALAAASGTTLSVAQARAAASTVLLQRAQAGLNATMLANPYILAATALAALIAYFAVYHESVDETAAAQKRLAESGKVVAAEAAREEGKIQSLVAHIKGLSQNREKQAEKVRELISLNPQLLSGITAENIATRDSTKAIEEYIAAKTRQAQVQKLDEELQASFGRAADAKNGKNEPGILDSVIDAMASMGNAYGTATDYTERYGKTKLRVNDQIVKSETELQKNILNQITAIQEVDAEVLASGKTHQEVAAKTVEYYNDEIDSLKKKQSAESSTSSKYLEFQKQINALEEKRTAITGKLTTEMGKAAKEAEKKGPFGSVAYWEYVKNAAEEVLQKTPTDKTALVASRKQAVVDAEASLEEARKRTAIKGFQEEIDEKKKMYEMYNFWVKEVGQAAADDQFKGLKASGANYVDYLTSEINRLKSIAQFTPLKTSDADRLSLLTNEKNSLTGKKSGMEDFKESIDAAKDSAETLTDTLVKLRSLQATLASPVTGEDYEKRNLIANEILSAEKERQRNLISFLQSVEGSEAKELEIRKHYSDLRSAVNANANKKDAESRKRALEQIAKAEKRELDEQALSRIKGSNEFKALNDFSSKEGTDALIERRDKIKNIYNDLKIAQLENTEEYREYANEIKRINKEIVDSTKSDYVQIGDAISSIGSAISQIDGGSSGIAQIFGQLVSGFGQLYAVIKNGDKELTKTDKINGYVAAVQAAVQLINIIVSSAKQRKEKEEEYYNSLIAYESEYQLALIKRIGLQAAADQNIFVKDYAKSIKAGVDQYEAAFDEYQKAIEKIENEGKAKVDPKNKANANATLGGAASGATLGFYLGTAIPGIGNLVGTIVGGIVGGAIGFFAGKKKKDVFGPILESFEGLITESEDGYKSLNKEMAQALINSNQLDDKTKTLVQSALNYADAMEEAKNSILDVMSELAGNLGNDLRDSLVNAFKSGEDSALAFRDTVSKVLEDMTSKLLFSQIFAPYFDQLQKDFAASADLAAGGDGTFDDDIIRNANLMQEAGKLFTDTLQQIADATKGTNYELFQQQVKDEAPRTLTGAIATISQESANELNGQFNAMRITQSQMVVIATNSLFELQAIRVNTSVLFQVVNKLDEMILVQRTAQLPQRNPG